MAALLSSSAAATNFTEAADLIPSSTPVATSSTVRMATTTSPNPLIASTSYGGASPTSYRPDELHPTTTYTMTEISYMADGQPYYTGTRVFTEYGVAANYSGTTTAVTTTASASVSIVIASGSYVNATLSAGNGSASSVAGQDEPSKPLSLTKILLMCMAFFIVILLILLLLFLRYRRRNHARLRALEAANASGTTLSLVEKSARGGFSSSPPVRQGRFSRFLSAAPMGRRPLLATKNEDYYSPTSPSSASPISPFSAGPQGYSFADDIATGTGLGATRGRVTGLPTLSDVRDSVILGRTRSIGSSRPSMDYAVTPFVVPTATGSSSAAGSSERYRTGSVTTYGETDYDDDDAIAVDGSSLARTLTTESSGTIRSESTEVGGTGGTRRSSSPVAWGSGPSREPSRSNQTGTGSYLTSFTHNTHSSATSPTTPGGQALTYQSLNSQASHNPFSDPFPSFIPPPARPYPARQGSMESEIVSVTSGAGRTEASYRTGDDQGSEVLPLGGGWRARGEAPPAYTATW